MCPDSTSSRPSVPDRLSETYRRVAGAAAWREKLFGPFGGEVGTSAYRLIHLDGDGFPGIAVDVYGGYLVVQVFSKEAAARASSVEDALWETLKPRGIVRKLRFDERERGRVHELVARGDKPPGVLTVLEDGMPFEVELLGGLHTGLFTDMRQEHVRMRSLAAGRRVLNTFAYTGAFSVAAGLGGATEITSVDVVAKVLERAKRNFRLAGLEPAGHHFARMDVREFLGMAARRGWTYDAIVLDPPTFATFKRGSWSLKADYPDLLDTALVLLAPGALLWMAVNTEGVPPAWIERTIEATSEKSGRRVVTLAVSGLPPDYPTPAAHSSSRYLKVHVLRVE